MGSSSPSTPQTIVTTQNKDPWAAAQPFLNEALIGAQGMYRQGVGYNPYTGPTQAPMQQALTDSLNQAYGIAHGNLAGSQGNLAAQGLASNMVQNQGLTPGIQGAISGLGQTGGLYGSVFSNNAGQANPYLQGVMDAQGRKIADQVNSTMSGAGRYGSGAHTNVLSRNLAEAQLPLLAQDYAQRQQTQLQALQGLGQSQQAQADLYGQGLNRAGQYSQLMPQLEAAQYAAADKGMQLGQYLTDRAQNDLNAQINLWNTQQAYPWEQLARFNAIATGAGGLGGSQVSSAPNLNAPAGGLQGALGGALAGGATGYSIFGPLGGALGALGGGLYGGLR